MEKNYLSTYFLILIIFFVGCSAKRAIDFYKREVKISNSPYWTWEASSVRLGEYGFKRKGYPQAFESLGDLEVSDINIKKRLSVSQKIVVNSLLEISESYTAKKLGEIKGETNRILDKEENFRVTIIEIKPLTELIKLINKNPTLGNQLKADRRARVITAIAMIFDHKSSQILDQGGELKVEITRVSGVPKFKFKVEDKETLDTLYADGVVVAYEMKEICWSETNGKAQTFVKDVWVGSEKGECPIGTLRGAKE